MSDVLHDLDFVLSVQPFLSTLGWVFAAAMAVGGLLDDNYKSIVRWIFAGVIYVIFQEIARASLIHATSFEDTSKMVTYIASLVTLLFYTTGLSFGWLIVWSAKFRVRSVMKEKKKEKDNAQNTNIPVDSQEKNAEG